MIIFFIPRKNVKNIVIIIIIIIDSGWGKLEAWALMLLFWHLSTEVISKAFKDFYGT